MATFASQIQTGLTTLLVTAEAAGVDLAFFSRMAAGAINRRLPHYTADVTDDVLELGVSYAWSMLRRRQRADDEATANAEMARILSEADALAGAEREEASQPVVLDEDGEEVDLDG